MPLAVRSVLYFCHFLYHSSVMSLAAKCSISVTACIAPLSQYCKYTAPFLILPVFQCYVPAFSFTTAQMRLYHLQFSVLLLPRPVSQFCLIIPASSVCCYSCHFCITALTLHHCQLSVLFLPLPVSQLCPLTTDSSVCYSCHCLYHSSAPSPLPFQCAIPATACITALPLHP
jgi:hypothetical protein